MRVQSSRPPLAAGTRLEGRYEVRDVLGEGGVGITYRARHIILHDDFAIKELLPEELATREGRTTRVVPFENLEQDFEWALRRFLDEARTLGKLGNIPGIVRVHDVFEANGTAYMVMPILHGESLETRLKRDGPMSPRAVERILWPLLDGLERIHATSFLHRDIKPANIMIGADGAPTLIDFGAARAVASGSKMTRILTPKYAPLEQWRGKSQDARTDIFALGITLFECATGKAPPSANRREAGARIEPLAVTAFGREAPALCRGIEAAIRLLPEERPSSIAEWRRCFAPEEVTKALPTRSQARPQPGPGSRPGRQEARTAIPAAPSARGAGRRGSFVRRSLAVAAFIIAASALLIGAREMGVVDRWLGAVGSSPSASVPAPTKEEGDGARNRQQAVVPEPPNLDRLLQAELNRVGCTSDAPTGVWGSGSREAMQLYNKSTGSTHDPSAATKAALSDVRTRSGRVCALTCNIGYQAQGGTCVAVTCPAGQVVTASGACAVVLQPVPVPVQLPSQGLPPGGRLTCFSFNGRRVCD